MTGQGVLSVVSSIYDPVMFGMLIYLVTKKDSSMTVSSHAWLGLNGS